LVGRQTSMLNCSKPLLLWLLPLVLWAWWWIGWRPAGRAAQVSLWRQRFSAGLRLFSLVCLVLALAGLRQRLPGDRLTVTLLVDQSLSCRRQQGFVQTSLEKILASRPDRVQIAVVHFAGEAALELAATQAPYLPRSTHKLNRDETNLAAALQYAGAAQPPDQAGRLLLISDGRQTQGDVLEAARGSAFEVDTLPLPQLQEPEVSLEELRCPPVVAEKSPLDLVATLYSSQPVRGAELQLLRQGRPAGRFRVDLKAGRNVFLLPQNGEKAGVVRYEARLSVAQDGERSNNQATGLTLVEGPSRVAVVHPPGQTDGITPVLRAHGLEADSLEPLQLPEDVGEWLHYQAVVLDNVSATELSTDQLEALTALVRDAGVGLLMLGGPDSFAAGGYAQTPLAEALPVDLRVRRSLLTPPSAQLHVLDKSGSMGEVSQGVEHIAVAREASIASLEILTAEDQFGLIGFDDACKWVVPMQAVLHPKALAGKIATLRAGGGTDLYPALDQGVKALARNPLSSRHILVLSDGATAPANFEALANRAQKQGIVISTVAVGEGADLDFLRRLAQNGKGRCYVADRIKALPRIFARETMLSARAAFDERPATLKLVERHALLQGIDAATVPALSGHNLVTPRGAPHRVLLETASGDPVLALGRYGLGKSVAFMGDNGRRWSGSWARRSDFSQMLLQAVRWCLPQSQQGALEVSAGLDSMGRLEVLARISPELAPQGLVGSLLAPDGRSQPLELVQLGPDRYELHTEFSGSGTFVISLGTPDGLIRVNQPVALQRSRELAGIEVQESLLRAVAERTGGKFQPTPQQVFRKPKRARVFYRELQRTLLILALLALLLEVAVRRLPLPSWAQDLSTSLARSSPVESTAESEETLPSLRALVKGSSSRRPRLELKDRSRPGPEPGPTKDPGPALPGDANARFSENSSESESQVSALDQLRKVRHRTRKKNPSEGEV